MAVISTGMLAHQSSAFTEGMFGPLHSEFERTPKTASVSRLARRLASARASATEEIDRAKVHWPYVLCELFFITYQLVWALIFAVSGMIWWALVAACVAGCIIYLALFYQGVWRYACDRSHSYARVLGATALLLVLLSIVGQFSGLTLEHALLTELAPIFDVDAEQNIPTFFSVLLLLTATLLLAVIATRANKQRISHASTWRLLAFGFLVMALDEALQLHERLNVPIGRLFGDGSLGVFYFPWVIPAAALVFGLGLFFSRFLWDLPSTARFRFLIAATLYVGGAVGVELLGSRHAELHGYENWTYSTIATLEESLEMGGLIVFIWALLDYGSDSYREARFTGAVERLKAA